ncbi:uncharacterized protein ACB058_019413 [Synchiropus picturatus]
MRVSERVLAARGDDAILNCSFTHPRQSSYSGRINVNWLTTAHPFFTCSIHNSSDADVSKCSIPGYKYTLAGDPRQGALVLLIRNLTLADERKYFCRVELEDGGETSRGIDLRVGEKPLILSLKEVNRSQNGRLLECVVEGNPLPTVTWFSKSKQQSQDPIGSEPSGMFQVTSWVSLHEDDQLTCQAENPLGRAEQTHPEESSLVLIISVCVTGGLLLLLLVIGLVVCRTLRRGQYPSAALTPSIPGVRLETILKQFHWTSHPSTRTRPTTTRPFSFLRVALWVLVLTSALWTSTREQGHLDHQGDGRLHVSLRGERWTLCSSEWLPVDMMIFALLLLWILSAEKPLILSLKVVNRSQKWTVTGVCRGGKPTSYCHLVLKVQAAVTGSNWV